MSAISSRPRADDPRVLRTRAAALDAARALFLEQGYTRTTMDEIAARAGITKRTLYNNYADKDALFTRIVEDVMGFATAFARGLRTELGARMTADSLAPALHDLAQRMALAIVRPEVVALRRLLIAESRDFPALATRYFERAPGQVIETLTAAFARMMAARLLRARDPRLAAEQFAYLAVGAPLDRAMLTGRVPSRAKLVSGARAGVATFLARYAAPATRRR